MKFPTCDIYYNEKNDMFSLINYAVNDQGFTVAFGDIIQISSKLMEDNGYNIIIKHLEEFSKRKKSEKAEYDLLSTKQQNKFEKDNKLIGIVFEDLNRLVIYPMNKCHGGYESVEGGDFAIEIPTSCDVFYESLLDAFGRCR